MQSTTVSKFKLVFTLIRGSFRCLRHEDIRYSRFLQLCSESHQSSLGRRPMHAKIGLADQVDRFVGEVSHADAEYTHPHRGRSSRVSVEEPIMCTERKEGIGAAVPKGNEIPRGHVAIVMEEGSCRGGRESI